MKNVLNTACGNTITLTERTLKHLEAHPEAQDLLEEAVGKVTLPEGRFLLVEVDMGRVIGKSSLVDAPTVAADETATFACRTGRDVPSRVVIGVEKPDTNLFTVIAGIHEDAWTLYTGFAGPSAPKEPTDKSLGGNNASELEFWGSHALVHEDGWDEPFKSTWAEVCAKAAAAG